MFAHPYIKHKHNRWTSPQLDKLAGMFRMDASLRVAAQTMKEKFLTQAQALIHGDLHSGSIMVTQDDTKIIDPEFAFYGPMGFDLGAYFGNLFLAIFSQPGHAVLACGGRKLPHSMKQAPLRNCEKVVA